MKKVQFGYVTPVVGVRWPSGAVTMIEGRKPLTAKEARRIISRAAIKSLKRENARGSHKEVAGVFIAPLNWTGWNAGI